jgi:hypothetical protein
MATANCPDKNCSYTTQRSERMQEHIKATKHGQKIKEFKGFKNGKQLSQGKKH